MNILVTGSEGQLGRELKVLSSQYKEFTIFFTDVNELDITDNSALKTFFNNHSINFIVNCAAYTQVDKAEQDKANAEKINTQAVANLVKLANNFHAKFIHISTDYVFDGKGNKPYTETDVVHPTSVYGITKLNGEIEAQRYINSVIIRTSWLYSSFGSNFVKTMLKLSKDKKEINVVSDQVGTPTYAADLAKAVFEIIKKACQDEKNFKPGIYHFSDNGICSWFDFASEIFRISKADVKVNPIDTSGYPTAAKRPAYSALDKTKIRNTYNITIPDWKDSLEKCLHILLGKNEEKG